MSKFPLMFRFYYLSLSVFVLFFFEARGQGYVYTHPIPFSLPVYVCYRVSGPVVLDGVPNEVTWQKVPWTDTFQDITGDENKKPRLSTKVKMLWDETYLYVAAELEEPHVWATLTERDAIMYQNDNFEVFIDPDGDGLYYYEFEINAHNAMWDLLMLHPYRDQRYPNYLMNWQVESIKSAVHISGTINNPIDRDFGWNVEMAIPWSALKEMSINRQGPVGGDKWRINFSRVDWDMDIKDGVYVKKNIPGGNNPPFFPAENWVWSPTGYVDMHRPECFGILHFSDIPAGEGIEKKKKDKGEEQIRWAMWQLFYLQNEYYRKNGSFCKDLSVFQIPEIYIDGYTFSPICEATTHHFEIRVKDLHSSGKIIISDLGRIWKEQ